MKNDLAPVVLTVFKRPWHTEETLISLSKNLLASDSILYVYCDGPKHGATEEDLINIAKVRELAKRYFKNYGNRGRFL